jgi:hypothetical protein
MKPNSRPAPRSVGQRQKEVLPAPAPKRANPALDSLASRSWLLLTYKVPPEPAKRRIALWRKLKALGAVYLQSGVCLLPKTEEHVRRLKVLEKEIGDMEGEAVLLETVGIDRAEEEKVVARFSAERDEAYVELISRCDDFEAEIARERGIGKFTYAEVEENEEDLTKLRAWLDKITRLDFCGAALRGQAEERVARCAALLDEYAREVFEAQDENRHGQGPSAGGKGG